MYCHALKEGLLLVFLRIATGDIIIKDTSLFKTGTSKSDNALTPQNKLLTCLCPERKKESAWVGGH